MKKHSLLYTALLAAVVLAPFSIKAQEAAEESEVYPSIVLGGGIGGLTSALYLSRAGIPPLIIEGAHVGGALMQSPKVQNWPGEFEIKGFDLVEKIRDQVQRNGSKFLAEEVIDVDFSKRPFTITTRSLYGKEKIRTIKAQTAIVALGTTPQFLGIPGENGPDGYWSHGVYTCAVCDGSLFKDKTIAVVGGGDTAITEAHYLSDIAKHVYVFVRGEEFKSLEKARTETLLAKPNVEVIYKSSLKEIKGDGENVTHVIVQKDKDKKPVEISVDGVFLAIGSKPNSTLFKNRLALDKQGFILLKKQQETSIPGVFAIGDIADPIYQQAVSAAGDGAKAALQVKSYLSSMPALNKMQNSEPMAIADAPLPSIIEIGSVSQFNEILKNSQEPLIADFYATWCGPCKHFAPVFDDLASTFSGKVKFLKVNVDVVGELSRHYQIKGIPSLLIFDKQGRLVAKKTGSKEINDFVTRFEPYAGQTEAQIEHFLRGIK